MTNPHTSPDTKNPLTPTNRQTGPLASSATAGIPSEQVTVPAPQDQVPTQAGRVEHQGNLIRVPGILAEFERLMRLNDRA